MLVQTYWLLSPLFILSTSICSALNTSISTIKQPTVSINSTYHISTATTQSSAVAPTSIPPAFYLVTTETYQNDLVGSYFKIIPDPDPINPLSGDQALQFNNKNSTGAANFTLNDDGTLQCNSDSGPLYASVSKDFPHMQTLKFEEPNELEKWGLVAVTCEIALASLICQWGPLVEFFYGPPNVVDGMHIGGMLEIEPLKDSGTFTLIQVVPT